MIQWSILRLLILLNWTLLIKHLAARKQNKATRIWREKETYAHSSKIIGKILNPKFSRFPFPKFGHNQVLA